MITDMLNTGSVNAANLLNVVDDRSIVDARAMEQPTISVCQLSTVVLCM